MGLNRIFGGELANARGVYVCIVALVLVGGCSQGLSHLSDLGSDGQLQLPVHQSAMTSVAHWERLADNSASHISGCMAGETYSKSIWSRTETRYCWGDTAELSGRSIYVAAGDQSTPFGRMFRKYLIASLMSRGHAIANTPDEALGVYSHAGIVARDGNQRLSSVPGAYSLLGYTWYAFENLNKLRHVLSAAVLADLWKYENEFSGAQAVVTTSLFDGQTAVMRKIDSYFIADSDWSQYVGLLGPLDQQPLEKVGVPPQVATLKVLGD